MMYKEKSIILPSINDCSSRQEWEDACWQKILKSEKFLQLLFTSYERRNLVKRAATLEGILSGKSYKQISEELWLSPQTISAIKKTINEKSYRSYLERSKKERKKRKYSYKPTTIKTSYKGKPHKTKYGTIYSPY